MNNYRIDYIITVTEVKQNDLSEGKLESLLCELEHKLAHSWNVSYTNSNDLQYLEMLIRILPNEEYIFARLQREGRNGIIDKLDDTLYKYSTELYDAWEIMTWVRTFIGRIESFFSTDRSVVKRFNEDFVLMKTIYGGDCDDIR